VWIGGEIYRFRLVLIHLEHGTKTTDECIFKPWLADAGQPVH
jgi:hypothetical protein